MDFLDFAQEYRKEALKTALNAYCAAFFVANPKLQNIEITATRQGRIEFDAIALDVLQSDGHHQEGYSL